MDIKLEHFDYLDDLRESGETNMWGAGAYLSREFIIDRSEASKILVAWMNTFDGESTVAERLQKALDMLE